MLLLFNKGQGITEIALEIQRTDLATIQIVEKLDLFERKKKPRHRQKQKPILLAEQPATVIPTLQRMRALYPQRGECLMFEQYPDILTVEEVCKALRMGCNAVFELLNAGKLKVYKNGRILRIPRDSLAKYVRESSNI